MWKMESKNLTYDEYRTLIDNFYDKHTWEQRQEFLLNPDAHYEALYEHLDGYIVKHTKWGPKGFIGYTFFKPQVGDQRVLLDTPSLNHKSGRNTKFP